MSPQRIQLRRTKGWRLPAGAVVVSRPSRWGNPYRVVRCKGMPGWRVVGMGECSLSADLDAPWSKEQAAEFAVERYRKHIPPRSYRARDAQVELQGRDLACWCPPSQACHADVLLEIANGGAS